MDRKDKMILFATRKKIELFLLFIADFPGRFLLLESGDYLLDEGA